MSASAHLLVVTLALLCASGFAVVPQTLLSPIYVTATAGGIMPRQALSIPILSPESNAPAAAVSSFSTGTTPSTTIVTTTLATTELVKETSHHTTPGPAISTSLNITATEWFTTRTSSYMSSTVQWTTCSVSANATCTNPNATTDGKGQVVIPVPIPVIVIVQEVVPMQNDPNVPPEDPEIPEQEKPSSFSLGNSKVPSSSFSLSLSSKSTTSSSSTSFSLSSSSASSATLSSSSSWSSTFTVGESCPTGSALELTDDEGDDEKPGNSCPYIPLALNDEDDLEIGNWADFGNSSIIPIPTFTFKPSSSIAVPTLTFKSSTLSSIAIPTLEPNPTSSPSSSSVESATPKPTSQVECSNIRPYTGRNAKDDCEKDDFCKTFEWWGPIGKDPLLKLPAMSGADNNGWDGFERSCEPVKETPSSYWCKSCPRNPTVCKITRWYNRNNWRDKSPIESCWTDEICESDRDHMRICHARNPWPNMADYQDGAFCMECRRNTPVEPDKEGCFKQMDFTDDGRQDFPPYTDHSYHDCGRYCKGDDAIKRYCVGQQCMSCPQ